MSNNIAFVEEKITVCPYFPDTKTELRLDRHEAYRLYEALGDVLGMSRSEVPEWVAERRRYEEACRRSFLETRKVIASLRGR